MLKLAGFCADLECGWRITIFVLRTLSIVFMCVYFMTPLCIVQASVCACVRFCLCVYLYLGMYGYACVCLCVHACVCAIACLYVFIFACAYVNACMCMCAFVCVCAYACECAYLCAYVCVCACTDFVRECVSQSITHDVLHSPHKAPSPALTLRHCTGCRAYPTLEEKDRGIKKMIKKGNGPLFLRRRRRAPSCHYEEGPETQRGGERTQRGTREEGNETKGWKKEGHDAWG